jgi:hypothetical protein
MFQGRKPNSDFDTFLKKIHSDAIYETRKGYGEPLRQAKVVDFISIDWRGRQRGALAAPHWRPATFSFSMTSVERRHMRRS